MKRYYSLIIRSVLKPAQAYHNGTHIQPILHHKQAVLHQQIKRHVRALSFKWNQGQTSITCIVLMMAARQGGIRSAALFGTVYVANRDGINRKLLDR